MRTITWSTKLAKSMARPNVGMHSLPGMPNDVDLSNPLKAWRRRGSPEDRRDGESRAWLTRRTWRYGQGIERQTRPWPRMLRTTLNCISRASVSFLASSRATISSFAKDKAPTSYGTILGTQGRVRTPTILMIVAATNASQCVRRQVARPDMRL